MEATVFESRPLPVRLDRDLRDRLETAHRDEPFSAIDARATVRRVAGLVAGLGAATTVYRGGLDLRGIEVDHLWLALEGRVLDAAFPLFVDEFVLALRGFVSGDVAAEELGAAADQAGMAHRVLGRFPAPVRYLGMPVWAARHGAG
ncbi:MAG: hypothetical protein H0V05_06905 [Euzebyaceae bacterium]|jgi:hypothetical protein|nr:hypothetical protein [Euzebyaceae bacterium]